MSMEGAILLRKYLDTGAANMIRAFTVMFKDEYFNEQMFKPHGSPLWNAFGAALYALYSATHQVDRISDLDLSSPYASALILRRKASVLACIKEKYRLEGMSKLEAMNPETVDAEEEKTYGERLQAPSNPQQQSNLLLKGWLEGENSDVAAYARKIRAFLPCFIWGFNVEKYRIATIDDGIYQALENFGANVDVVLSYTHAADPSGLQEAKKQLECIKLAHKPKAHRSHNGTAYDIRNISNVSTALGATRTSAHFPPNKRPLEAPTTPVPVAKRVKEDSDKPPSPTLLSPPLPIGTPPPPSTGEAADNTDAVIGAAVFNEVKSKIIEQLPTRKDHKENFETIRKGLAIMFDKDVLQLVVDEHSEVRELANKAAHMNSPITISEEVHESLKDVSRLFNDITGGQRGGSEIDQKTVDDLVKILGHRNDASSGSPSDYASRSDDRIESLIDAYVAETATKRFTAAEPAGIRTKPRNTIRQTDEFKLLQLLEVIYPAPLRSSA